MERGVGWGGVWAGARLACMLQGNTTTTTTRQAKSKNGKRNLKRKKGTRRNDVYIPWNVLSTMSSNGSYTSKLYIMQQNLIFDIIYISCFIMYLLHTRIWLVQLPI